MIDIHTHLLPGVDDGAADLSEAVLMIKQAAEAGTDGIICTPHMNCGKQRFTTEDTKKVFDAFASEIRKAGISFSMWLGGEVYCSFENVHEIIDMLRTGQLPTINGTRYVLVEMDREVDYEDMLKAVRKLICAGFMPIMAHIERYSCLFRKSERIRELAHEGALIQINAKTLFKGRLSREKGWLEELLLSGWIHFVATDCHESQVRTPADLERAKAELARMIGEDGAGRILDRNPKLMLEGEYIETGNIHY